MYALATHQLQVERRERHRANQVYALAHTSYRWRGERDIEPIKWMHSHTPATGGEERESYSQSSVCSRHKPATGGERERHRANQVDALATHQLQVERRESHRANQVYAFTTHQLQVERRESHRANQVYAQHTPATGGEEGES